MADTVSTNQFKNGMHIELEGGVWRIVEFQHVKPGKGGAFVRTKVKNADTGAVVDKTFRAGEKFARVFTETKNVQYLYDDGPTFTSWTRRPSSSSRCRMRSSRMRCRSCCRRRACRSSSSAASLPACSCRRRSSSTVTDTEPGVKGDTVSNVTKPATLETGAVVQVPLFVNVGDRIKVDPREARYISRA